MKRLSNTTLFVVAMCLLAAAGAVFEPTFNNYLDDTFGIAADQRGMLELPREFPGFLVALVAGALFFLGEVNLSVLGACFVAMGLFGLAAFARTSDRYPVMMAFMVIWSTGTHLTMPVTQSLALALAGQEKEGEKLGKLNAVTSAAAIGGACAVWLNFRVLRLSYSTVFLVGMCLALGATAVFWALKRNMSEMPHGQPPRLVLKKRYWLYYLLSILYGARKQMFLTFGPWVLIKLFGVRPATFAILWAIATGLRVVLLPLAGRLIDSLGERRVLMGDAALLILICLVYGFALDILPATAALIAVAAAYVVDQLLFPVQMARATYLSKIAQSRQDISGTLGLGVSLDHAVSIPAAMLGGALWVYCDDHRPVFWAAAGLAALILAASHLVRVPPASRPEFVEPPERALEDVRPERL